MAQPLREDFFVAALARTENIMHVCPENATFFTYNFNFYNQPIS